MDELREGEPPPGRQVAQDCIHGQGQGQGQDLTHLLPDEVLQLVLREVPAHDLVASARLVCRRWCRLVSGRCLWRRVRLVARVGHEEEVVRVLRLVPDTVPALAELVLFLGDRQPTRCPGLVLRALQRALAAGLELHSLSLDWRHFSADPICFHGILEAARDVLLELDVGLVGVEAMHPASPLHPQPAPAFAALADLRVLDRLRVRALFDPCWYFEELRSPRHQLRSLDVSECEPYLERLMRDLLHTHAATLTSLRLHIRSVAAALPVSLPCLKHLAVDLDHQDAKVTLPRELRQQVSRLTLAKLNRRLPTPNQDVASEAVQSVCGQVWPALHTLELQDCLLSPTDIATIVTSLSPVLRYLVVREGSFLGSKRTLVDVVGSRAGGEELPARPPECVRPESGSTDVLPTRTTTRLFPCNLRCCPRDPATGLYPLVQEP